MKVCELVERIYKTLEVNNPGSLKAHLRESQLKNLIELCREDNISFEVSALDGYLVFSRPKVGRPPGAIKVELRCPYCDRVYKYRARFERHLAEELARIKANGQETIKVPETQEVRVWF